MIGQNGHLDHANSLDRESIDLFADPVNTIRWCFNVGPASSVNVGPA